VKGGSSSSLSAVVNCREDDQALSPSRPTSLLSDGNHISFPTDVKWL